MYSSAKFAHESPRFTNMAIEHGVHTVCKDAQDRDVALRSTCIPTSITSVRHLNARNHVKPDSRLHDCTHDRQHQGLRWNGRVESM